MKIGLNCIFQGISEILDEISKQIGIEDGAEVTLEMDPGTFDMARLANLKSRGINRVSIGVQSFDDEMLKACGRAHNSLDVYNAMESFAKVGLENYSIDLISSLPGMTMEKWSETLRQACTFKPPHISVYDLQIEDKTAFGRWFKPGLPESFHLNYFSSKRNFKGVFPLPTEETSAAMYRSTVDILSRHGYEHYEVSNYAQPGRRSRHNQKYWKREPYWAFGMGAASYVLLLHHCFL